MTHYLRLNDSISSLKSLVIASAMPAFFALNYKNSLCNSMRHSILQLV